MKTLARCVLIALILTALLGLVPVHAETLRHVWDEAGLLDQAAIERIEKKAQALYDDYQFDVLFLTSYDTGGKSVSLFTMDSYDLLRDYQRYPNGALFAVITKDRDYHESARGTGEKWLTRLGADSLAKVVRPGLSSGNYERAFMAYLDYVKTEVTKTDADRAIAYTPYAVIASAVISFFSVFSMKSKFNPPRLRREATDYLVPSSFNLTASNDIFLYETVTKTRIETNSGGSSGGSSRGFSSSGNSYGNRGGKY